MDVNASICDDWNGCISCTEDICVTVYTAPGMKNASRSRCNDDGELQLEMRWHADGLQTLRLVEIEYSHKEDRCASEAVSHRLWPESMKMYDCLTPIVNELRGTNEVQVTSNRRLEKPQTTTTVGHYKS